MVQRLYLVIAVLVAALGPLSTLQAQPLRGFFNRPPAPGFLPGVDITQSKDAPHKLEAARQYLKGEKWDEAVEMYRSLMESDGDLPTRVVRLESRQEDFYERYISVRQLCQMKLAALHETAPVALQLYRKQVDALAGKWFQQASQSGDEALLHRIVDRYFVSSFGDDAALLLGECYLQRGEYAAARRCWQSISIRFFPPPSVRWPSAYTEVTPLWRMLHSSDATFEELWPGVEQHLQQPGRPTWLVYPDPDPALLPRAFARLVLTSILEGSQDRAEVELKAFEKLYPEATGKLAGQQGNLLAILQKIASGSSDWKQVEPSTDWPTLGGSLSRTKVMPHGGQPLDIVPVPLWKFQLHREQMPDGVQPTTFATRIGESLDGFMSYHPVVVDVPGKGKTVLVHDRTQVYALNLRTGKPALYASVVNEESDVPPHSIIQLEGATPGEHSADRPESIFNQTFPNPSSTIGTPRFTLSVSDGQLISRLGSPLTGSRARNPNKYLEAMITTLPLSGSKEGSRSFKIDDFKPEEDQPGQRWAFDGTPICHNGRLYTAMRLTAPNDAGANLAKIYVVCFELATARQLWVRKICGASTIGGGNGDEITHTLLSYSDGLIFINTNLGAVAALRAGSGELEWLMKYKRAQYPNRRRDDPDDSFHFLRDLNPCVIHKGIVVTMPADSEHIFALDSQTGVFLWELMPQSFRDASHILGVGHGNLILGGKNLYWVDIQKGRMHVQFPWGETTNLPGHAGGGPPGYGRGFLAGDFVYWPTRNKIYVFRQQLKRSEGQSRYEYQLESIKRLQPSAQDFKGFDITGGNLLVVDDIMLIATPSGLYAYDEFGPQRPGSP